MQARFVVPLQTEILVPKRKTGLYATRPGVARLQTYLPTADAAQLVALADAEGKTASRKAAELLLAALEDYAAGRRIVQAPPAFRRQPKIA